MKPFHQLVCLNYISASILKVLSSDSFGQKHIRSILIGKDGSTFNGLAFNALNTPLEGYLNKKNKKLFNVAGKKIESIFSGYKKVGIHVVYWYPQNLCSGFYFICNLSLIYGLILF